MPTWFYNRTPFQILEVDPPHCFRELDAIFDQRNLALSHPKVALAENLCKRLGDVAYYAAQINRATQKRPAIEAALETSTLLGGHFSACKSVLDAGAISISAVYQVGVISTGRSMTKGELDLWRGQFRNVLRKEVPAVAARIDAFANLYREITEWRDSAVHRVQPLVVVHSSGPPKLAEPRDISIQLLNEREADWSALIPGGPGLPWVEPLYFHRCWYTQLEAFCAVICDCLAQSTGHT